MTRTSDHKKVCDHVILLRENKYQSSIYLKYNLAYNLSCRIKKTNETNSKRFLFGNFHLLCVATKNLQANQNVEHHLIEIEHRASFGQKIKNKYLNRRSITITELKLK